MPTVDLGPAGANSRTSYDYWTYRSLTGNNIYMRLTDVSFWNGYQFSQFKMDVQLRDSSGVTHCSGSLYKTWGVPPGFTKLSGGFGAAHVNVRIRIQYSTAYTAPEFNLGGFDWTGQLSW